MTTYLKCMLPHIFAGAAEKPAALSDSRNGGNFQIG